MKRKKKRKRRRKYVHLCCCSCPIWWLLLLLLLLLALLALLLAFLIPHLLKKRTETVVIIADANQTTTWITSIETTTINCADSCLTQSWIDSSNSIGFWPFDTSLNDNVNYYNPISSLNHPSLSTGYIRQAALFDASAQQSIFIPFIPITRTSFTVEAWINPTGYPNSRDHTIVGLCPAEEVNHCLHINIRNEKLYFGFYYNDVGGQTTISTNQWIHTAFVYDSMANIQRIYLNGVLDGEASVTSSLLATTGNFTIGVNEVLDAAASYFQGYIDQLLVTRRAKSSCEILERATLAARFEFDSSSPYTDSGPNNVSITQSTATIVIGRKNQAISFAGTSASYFQAWGFTSLGITNQPFSIALWIKPYALSGTLLHLSTSSTGTGSTCFPLLGFDSNGAIVAQVLTNAGTVVSVTGPTLPTSSSWTPIIQTWSTTNGLRLYVNGTLVGSGVASTFLGSETTPNYLTLGNCLNGCSSCTSGSVGSAGPYTGVVDDWHIFNRELTSSDVCTLSHLV